MSSEPRSPAPGQTDPAVLALIAALEPDQRALVAALRALVLETAPEVREEIKWNAPSFRAVDHFATMNLRAGRVWLILHTGARTKASAAEGLPVSDPDGLLEWLAKDRAVVKLRDLEELASRRASLLALLRRWVAAL